MVYFLSGFCLFVCVYLMHIQLVSALPIRTGSMRFPVFESMCDTEDRNGRGKECVMVVTQIQLYLSSVL